MRPAALLTAALALVSLTTCRRRVERPRAPAALTVEAPSHRYDARASPVPGAAAPVAHPRAERPLADLGARVAPRPLPLPRVGLGRSARFRFDGGRRGWVLQLADGQRLATPAYADGKVFVGAGFTSTTVYALDARTGALRWTGATPDGGPTAAIVEDGAVLFNTESCTLFAFDARTGRQRWSRWLGDPLMSQPAAANGRVFSAYPNGDSPTGFRFAALSLRTGRVLWSRPLAADAVTAPVIHGDAVYVTAMDGSVYRFSAARGRVAWRRALGATSAPAVDGDRVFLAQRRRGGAERALVLDAGTGRTVSSGPPVRAAYAARRPDTGGVEAGWSFEGARPTYADGRLYQAIGAEIVARDAASGRELWRRRHPSAGARRAMTSPAVAGSVLVFGTRDGDLFGLDVDTGATTWAYHVGEPIAFQPAVARGWVYAATARGKVIGLEVADPAFDGWHMWGGNARHDGLAPPEAAAPPPEPAPTQGTLRLAARAATPFPLLHTSVRAAVSGPVARVEVEQTFRNPFPRAVDAEYLLPLPANAAVDAMDLRVGDRTIRGAIDRRAAARARYEAARACGLTAALLEQERPNLFRQAVANVRPGEAVRVVVRFAAAVAWRDGAYELALPLATGSRFTPGAGAVTPTRPPGDVDVSASLDLGAALDGVTSPSHPVTVAPAAGTTVAVRLRDGAAAPDRDFVLRYRPRAASVEPSVLAARRDGAGYFTLTLHPGARAPEADLAPRELVFLVDASSSMRGAPLAQARALVRRALDHVRPGDTFRVVRFADEATASAPAPQPPTPASLAAARAFVDDLRAGGTTAMLAGLREALAAPGDPTRLRLVVLVTDGYIGNEREALAAITRDLGAARLFALGVGAAVNRYLLEQAAEVGRGHAEVVLPSDDPRAAAERFHARIARPVLTDVAIDFGGLDVTGVYPRVVPDLFADAPLQVHGRYGRAGAGTVTVTGRLGGRPWSRALRVALPDGARDHEALPSLWARARVHDLTRAMLLGEVPALRDEVTDLGLRHGLVTDYTAFVAVDERGGAASGCRARVPGVAGAGGGGGGSAMGAIGLGSFATMGYGGGGGSYRLVGGPVAAPRVRAAPPVVQGLASPDLLRSTVVRNLPQVRACYQRALQSRPGLAGRVVVRFVVGGEGRVLAAAVAERSLDAPEVAECIVEAVRAWQFAVPGGGVTVVTYPFTFEPAPPARGPAGFTLELPVVPR